MKKLSLIALGLALLLSACNQQETPKNNEPATEASSQPAQSPAEPHDHHHHDDDHDDEPHDHHDHDHAGHDHHHHHHDGEHYKCDNSKEIHIAVHDHEGEIEAHAIIDDIEYDLNADTNQANQFISHDEGLNNQGMILTIDGDKATFSDLNKKPLLACTKQSS